MLSLASNRYSVLSEEVSDRNDLRIEMEDLQEPSKDTEQDQVSEVRGVSASNIMTRLTAFHS